MPDPRAVLQAYGLTKGVLLSRNLKIYKVDIQHRVITEFQEYEFPMRIYVETTDLFVTKDEVLEQCTLFVQNDKIVYSQYNNPYTCHLQITQVNELHTLFDKIRQSFIVNCTGTALRLKELPT